MHRVSSGWFFVLLLAPPVAGQEPLRLVESFAPGIRYHVKLRTDLDGRLTVSVGKEMTPQLLPLAGTGTLAYDERVLPADEASDAKVVRAYRQVEFRRTLGDRQQQAGVRPAVRRMVVLRSARGKSPFSPDGPLLWDETDVVRNDVFCPVLVPAVLPPRAVRPGDEWPLAPAGVSELTDMEKAEDGGFAVRFVGVVAVDGRRQAKLAISGTARGVDEHGPCRHSLDGTAFFDLEASRLAYLSLRGTHDLLDATGAVNGRVNGKFVMERTAAGDPPDLSDAKLAGVELRPTADNSALLFDNPELGLRFEYPRRWRVGAVQGRQVTLDGPNGGGMLVTAESPAKLPSADAYRREAETFLAKEKAPVTNAAGPVRVSERPAVDRFGLDTELNGEKLRMEYAVVGQADGGVTLAARLPRADAGVLTRDVEKVVRTLAVTKPIR